MIDKWPRTACVCSFSNNTKAGFKAKSKINRKDYKLMWGAVTEAGGMVVSDEVEIAINLELSQAK